MFHARQLVTGSPCRLLLNTALLTPLSTAHAVSNTLVHLFTLRIIDPLAQRCSPCPHRPLIVMLIGWRRLISFLSSAPSALHSPSKCGVRSVD